ncbi:MAG TPA: PaaX family transcriptional regulator C-terminal domain-containing protein [Candidatus Acidoferrales bacterium]|nr:PaaX family transcriptional regulator C-terminal domain-containing protein [Candidatus Acidoferrales bacterium]
MPDSQPQPQELVVTVLGAYLTDRHRTVWSGGLVRLLREMGFSTAAARVALARMVGRGLLTRERDGRLVHYRMTARCVALLEEGDRRIFSLGQPARHKKEPWTVLWHAIPDECRLERGRLARRLRFLGFGSVQDGTWIAARDRQREVAAVLRDLGVAGYAALMVGKPSTSLDFAAFVARTWDLDRLAERYRAFVDEFGSQAGSSADRLLDEEAFLLRTRLVHTFRAFPALDPELPADVIAPPAHRSEALSVFRHLFGTLQAPAQRHFDAVATP